MSEIRKIVLIGAGGHCKSIIDILIESYQYDKIVIIDKEKNETNINIMGIPIVGNNEDLISLFKDGFTDVFIAIGSIGDVTIRKKLYNIAKKIGFNIPNVIDKTSVIGKEVRIGEGVFIGKNTVINADTKIGDCAIINTSCTIEHECQIEDFVHIAPGCIICGNVSIEKESHIGAGTVIKQGTHIGKNVIIGMGSVVLTNIECYKTAYGNPCKEISNG